METWIAFVVIAVSENCILVTVRYCFMRQNGLIVYYEQLSDNVCSPSYMFVTRSEHITLL